MDGPVLTKNQIIENLSWIMRSLETIIEDFDDDCSTDPPDLSEIDAVFQTTYNAIQEGHVNLT